MQKQEPTKEHYEIINGQRELSQKVISLLDTFRKELKELNEKNSKKS